jgi:hypothetical protein
MWQTVRRVWLIVITIEKALHDRQRASLKLIYAIRAKASL